jgi:ubiquinone/menaquinone biosynthesis C-methylase UbiE
MEHELKTTEFHDSIAADYDDLFNASDAGTHMRERVQQRLLHLYGPGQHILEINCGTGTDAVVLGSAGIRVHATDVSHQMVRIASEKVAARNLTGVVTTEVVDADHLELLNGPLFDGAFSNFDGLNHVEDLARTMHQLARLVKPGGRVLCVLLNTVCLWEVCYFVAKLQPGRAWRRTVHRAEELSAGVHKMGLHLFTPRQFQRIVQGDFLIARIRALGLLLPPAGFPAVYERFNGVIGKLKPLDEALSLMYPFLLLGDHFMVEMERRT